MLYSQKEQCIWIWKKVVMSVAGGNTILEYIISQLFPTCILSTILRQNSGKTGLFSLNYFWMKYII